mgnify:CR=1 FL=1
MSIAKLCQRSGFSLIEILVIISVMAVLITIGALDYNFFRQRLEIDTTANQIISVLRLARNLTMGSNNGLTYGVHFENNQYVLFDDSVYAPAAPDNKIYALSAGVEIYGIVLTGGSDVIFNRIEGTTDNDGYIQLRLINKPSEQRRINILSSGQAGISAALTPTGSRITDSRHMHLDLGWSIRDATTLTFDFADGANPDVQKSINMAEYFNFDQPSFNWEGAIDVNGSTQALKVHSHFLDSFDTILCIHRDRRYNDKEVALSIDIIKDIIFYALDGTPTNGAFGGVMDEQ